MSTKELAELLLAALYEETESLGHSNFFLSVDEIAVNLGVEDMQGVAEAARILEEQGHILLAFDHSSAMSAFITPGGEEFINKGGETGIVGEYRRYRSMIANAPSGGAAGNVPLKTPPIDLQPPLVQQNIKPPQNEGMTHIIASMDMLVRNDPSLSDDVKEDLATDIRTLELQLSKKEMNRPLIDMIISALKEMPTLSPLLDLLISMK